MHDRKRSISFAVLLSALALAACNRGPSRSEALQALRAATPGIDTTTVFARVWQDGPPWFSCAEVIAKFTSPVDSAAVRDQVGNWKPLVLAGWLVLRDTSSGIVSDPGWCTGKLADAPARLAGGWIPIVGDSFPTHALRRGWRVPVGTVRLAVTEAPKAVRSGEATVDYVATIAPNGNGVAAGADRDTTFGVAELRQRDGRWEVTATRVRSPGPSRAAPAR
jgi:hypothetical protein